MATAKVVNGVAIGNALRGAAMKTEQDGLFAAIFDHRTYGGGKE